MKETDSKQNTIVFKEHCPFSKLYGLNGTNIPPCKICAVNTKPFWDVSKKSLW